MAVWFKNAVEYIQSIIIYPKYIKMYIIYAKQSISRQFGLSVPGVDSIKLETPRVWAEAPTTLVPVCSLIFPAPLLLATGTPSRLRLVVPAPLLLLATATPSRL